MLLNQKKSSCNSSYWKNKRKRRRGSPYSFQSPTKTDTKADRRPIDDNNNENNRTTQQTTLQICFSCFFSISVVSTLFLFENYLISLCFGYSTKMTKRLYEPPFGCFLPYFCCFYCISASKQPYFSLLWIFRRSSRRHDNRPLSNCLARDRTTQAIDRCFSYEGGEFFLSDFSGFRLVLKSFACVCHQFHQPERQFPSTT